MSKSHVIGTTEATTEATVSRSINTSAGRTDGSETGVDPVNFEHLRPFPDTNNVIMPYVSRSANSFSIAATTTATGQNSIGIRLNSIYDCITTAVGFTADPTPAADTADATVNKPMLMDYWMSLYRYWTVTKTTYKVSFWLQTQDNTAELSIWCYHNGQQQPPLVDDSGTPQIVPDYMRQTHKHCHSKKLRPAATNSTETHIQSRKVVFEGVYYPGNKTVVNDVAEDEFKETWHKATEVPSQREIATFIWNKSDKAPAVAVSGFWYVEVTYHVQLKDLKAIYQYPCTLR